jgi:hypothetical protein
MVSHYGTERQIEKDRALPRCQVSVGLGQVDLEAGAGKIRPRADGAGKVGGTVGIPGAPALHYVAGHEAGDPCPGARVPVARATGHGDVVASAEVTTSRAGAQAKQPPLTYHPDPARGGPRVGGSRPMMPWGRHGIGICRSCHPGD